MTEDKKPQRIAKEKTVAELAALIDESSAALLVDYRGLNVAEDTQLRRRMRSVGVTYRVDKNTLIMLACRDKGIDCLDSYLEGTTAMAFSKDPVVLAKTITQFMTEFKKLQVKAGVLDKKFMSPEKLDALSKLPSREVLLSQVLGAMQSPMTAFAGVCAGMLRQLVTVVDKVREQKKAAQ